VKSESARLLRQWWDEPGDYQWVVEFYRRRGLMSTLRAGNVFGGIVTVLALSCLLFEDLIQPWWLSHGVVAYLLVCSLGWIVFWQFFPWPPAWQAAGLFAFADVGVAIATFLHADPLAALSTAPLFAMSGVSICFYFGPRAIAAHMTLATATTIAATTWLALSDRPDALGVAGAKGLIAWAVAAGIFPFVHFGFWLIRSNSVESLTDPLTGLANRRGLANYLDSKRDALASFSTPLGVFVIDLDGFKNINDIYGHTIGDTVIARTAEQIRAAVGPTAFVARTGGEEFVVLDLLTLPNAAPVAERIRAAIEAPDTPKATASVGVAVGSIKDVTAFEAIHAIADETMYAAKRSGGNRIALAGYVESADSSGKRDEIQLLPTELKERYSLGTESLGL